MTTIYLNHIKMEATLDDEWKWSCDEADMEDLLNWQTKRMNLPQIGGEHFIAQTVCNKIKGGGKILSEPEEKPRNPKMIY